jgi:hypothetical protein
MNRSKLSIKAILLMCGVGLAGAFFAGSQPVAASPIPARTAALRVTNTIRAMAVSCRITLMSPMTTAIMDIHRITRAMDLGTAAGTMNSATA